MLGLNLALGVAAPGQRSLLQRAISAIRRNGGTALYVPDDYGLVLGPELGPGTASTAGWTANSAILTIAAGRLKCTTTSTGDNGAYVDIPTSVGKDYFVSVQITNGAATATAGARIATSGWAPISTSADVPAGQTRTITFSGKATTTLTRFAFDRRASGAVSGEILTLGPLQIREILTATTYIDSTGTQPVTAVGDLVGLLTDRSYGAGNLGVELAGSVDLSAPFVVATAIGGMGVGIPVVSASGKTFKVTYTITASTYSGDFFHEPSGGCLPYAAYSKAVGTWSYIVKADDNDPRFNFQLGGGGSPTGSITFSSFSVREVLGNHATQPTTASKPVVTRVPKRLGPNLVSNGTFDSGAGWNPGAGWVISGGVATCTSSTININQDIAWTVGRSYQVTFDATVSSGGVRAEAGMSISQTQTTNGKLVAVLSPTSGDLGKLYIYGPSAFTGTIDNITVQEVLEWTPALKFDGSNDSLITTSTTGTTGWVSVALVADALGNMAACGNGALSAGVDAGVAIKLRSTGAIWFRTATTAAQSEIQAAASYASGTPVVLTMAWTASLLQAWVNGVSVGTVLNPNVAASGALYLGCHGASLAEMFNGKLADIALGQSTLTEADRKTIERNMAQRIGATYAG